MTERTNDETIEGTNAGAVDTTKTVKAGCGIRYDPEVLGEDSGFDFSAAEKLKSTLTDLSDPEDEL
ncbi:hypothetical protein [Alkalimarinus sediminis]|uniref:Uncharacterized protein n=1 Tax=Alkalimarinus sediminis TaxID=1632866 RepID=A0A9E8HRP1_9ALTE|nr:hypothetical protein [Alkalimarinus sediminis]UZW75236.1 hypothetical protein NNL22_01105 [Alkalimarinus sediminis]